MTMPVNSNFYATADDDKAEVAKKFLMRNLLVIVSVLLMIVSVIALSMTLSGRSDALERQRGEILALESELSTVKTERDSSRADVLRQATGGVDAAHRDSDDALIRDLLDTALTWDGVSEYLNAREQVKERFGLDDNSQFMQVFMPGEMAGVARTDASGQTHYAVDADISNSFDSMDSTIIAVNGDVYSYITLVGMRTASEDGQTTVLSHSLLRYDVVDGRVANLVAETVPAGVSRTQ